MSDPKTNKVALEKGPVTKGMVVGQGKLPIQPPPKLPNPKPSSNGNSTSGKSPRS